MQFNKTLSYLFVALLSLSLLTGCGNGSSNKTPAVENNSSQENNATQEGGSESNSTPTPTSTVEPTATPTPTPTVEPTATPTPTSTVEPTATPTPTTQKSTISGYVVDDPIKGANISIYSIDGKLLKDKISTNDKGYFEAKISNLPSEYIVYSDGGSLNGEAFNGELFSVCNSNSCNLTPLSTLVYQYANSLLSGTFSKKYEKAKKTVIEYLGVSNDDIYKIKNSNGFNFNEFRKLVKTQGFNTVIANLENDLVDGYIDDTSNQKLFSSYLKRVKLPLPSEIETVKSSDGKELKLTVEGADGGDYSQGYLIDVSATKKTTVVNEDGNEVDDNQVVYLGFGLGEYKNKLNSETTVLAKLFMSNISLTLLPNDAKLSLIKELKQNNSELYSKTVDAYKYIVQEGIFYEPLFDEKFNVLVGKAQIILQNTVKSKSTFANQKFNKAIVLRKAVLFSKKSKPNFRKTEETKRTLSPFLNVSYDDQNHSFEIENRLPVFFGMRETKNSYSWKDNFLVPLVQPSEGGAAGVALSQYDFASSLIEWTTGKDIKKKTTFYGEVLSPDIFPSASEVKQGKKELELFKSFGLNSPTVRNVGLGISSIFKFLSGSGVSSKFNKILDKFSGGFEKAKKVLRYAQTGVDIAKGFSQFLYLIVDERLKDNTLTKEEKQIFVRRSNYFKSLYKTCKIEEEAISEFSSLIPDTNLIVKNTNGYFLTSINNKRNKAENSVILQILNASTSKVITKKNAIKVIVGGKIMSLWLNSYTFEGNSLFNESLNKEASEFNDKWDYTISDFHKIMLYKKFSKRKYKQVYTRFKNSKITTSDKLRQAEHEYLKFISKIFLLKEFSKKSLELAFNKLLSPINLGKKLASIQRLSANEALGTIKDMIVKEVKDSGEAILKGVIQSAVKQATLIVASGGSAAVIKGVQAADLINELAGIGGAIYLTPSVIPFAIETDANGKLKFKNPTMKVMGAINNIKTENGDKFLILSKQDSDTSPLIVLSSDINNPTTYNLSYNILFKNSKDNLEGLFASNSNWNNGKAVEADMLTRKYNGNRLDGSLAFDDTIRNHYKYWEASPEELSSLVKPNKTIGSQVDLISVLNKQGESFLQSIFSSTRSTTVSSNERGIFNEVFTYKIYEPKDSAVAGKFTKIDSFTRNIFKITNAKDLRKGLKLYKYDDKKLAITNNTGGGIILYNNNEEYYLANGETKLYPNNFFHSILITDSIVKEYGKSKGLNSIESTINYLDELMDNSYDYYAKPQNIDNAKDYSFILRLDKKSFTDKKPDENINIVSSDDFLSILKNNNLKTILYYDDTKDEYSYLYPLAQYSINANIKHPVSNLSFINNKSSSIITTKIPDTLNGSVLNNNYKIENLMDFNMTIELDEYNRISYVTMSKGNKKIELMITEFTHTENGDRMVLEITDGAKNLFKCIKDNCQEYPKRRDANYLLLSTISDDFKDDDNDGILNGLDDFPNKSQYQSDSDQDGMPDSWETEYGLNPNDPSDASKDLNKNGKTNLEEFTDGTNPKNTPPTANAGEDKTIITGENVTLNGTGTDAEDATEDLSFEWTNKDGDVIGEEAKVTIPSNRILADGNYTFTLTVTDSDGASSSDDVVVRVVKDNSQDKNLTKGLVAHYEFEGNAKDSSGNGNDGTGHNISYQSGIIGDSLKLDDTNHAYIDLGHYNGFDVNYVNDVITLSAWVNTTDEKGEIFSDNTASGWYDFMVYDGKLSYTYRNTNWEWGGRVYSNEVVNDGKWHLVTIIIDGYTTKLYVDGKFSTQKTFTDSKLTWSGTTHGSSGVSIGAVGFKQTDTGRPEWDSWYLNGSIDDLRIYNRALNESEIKKLYEMGSVKNNGLNRNDSLNIVVDNSTSLMWQDNSEITSKKLGYYDAKSYCSNLNLGGYDDWKVPSLKEWSTLYEHKLDTFQNFTSSYGWAWSSENYNPDYDSSGATFRVRSLQNYLYVTGAYKTDRPNFTGVRCVRGNLKINFKKGNGVVKEENSNLIWQDTYEVNYEHDLKNYCENLNINGVSGFRLPTIKELYLISDTYNHINSNFANKGRFSTYKTYNYIAYSPENNLTARLDFGTLNLETFSHGKPNLKGYTRCVR